MPTFPVKMKLAAVDRMSRVIQKVTRNLKGIGRVTRAATNRFKMFQDRTKGVRKSLAKIGSAVKSIGVGLTAKVTAPIAAMGVGIIRTASNFESAFNEVIAKATVKGGKNLDDLREQAIKMGTDSVFSATQAAQAQAFLTKAGSNTTEVFQQLPGVLNLAAASSMDLATAADITSNIMGAFELSADKTTHVSNVLARATAGANVDMAMLGETFKKVAPIAKEFGATIEDGAAIAGLLGNIGIQGSEAGTAMKAAFLGLAAPAGKARKLLESLGVKVFDKQKNKMVGFAEILKQLGGRLKQLPKDAQLGVLKEVFGKLSVSGTAALTKFATEGKLQDFIKQMSDTTVTAQKMADTMNAGSKGGMKAFMSALEGLAIRIGQAGVLEMFTKLLMGEKKDGNGGVVGFVRWLAKLAKQNPTMVQLAVVLGLVAAVIGPVVLGIGAFIAILPALMSGAAALGIGLGALGLKLALIGGVFTALVVAGFFLVKHWDIVKLAIMDTWQDLKDFMDTTTGKILTVLFAFVFPMATLAVVVAKNWELLKVVFMEFLEWLAFKSVALIDRFNKGWEVTKKIPGIIGDGFKMLWESIVGGFDRAMKRLDGKIAKAKNRVKSAFGIEIATPVVSPKVQARIEKLKASRAAASPLVPPSKVQPGPVQSKERSEIKIDFSNLPQGATVQTKSTNEDIFNINTGLQGAAL